MYLFPSGRPALSANKECCFYSTINLYGIVAGNGRYNFSNNLPAANRHVQVS